MIKLADFIIEALESEARDSIRKLQSKLKGSYEASIEELNEMLKDPKSASVIENAFGGNWSTLKLRKVEPASILVRELTPTQNEIDLGKSVKFGICDYPQRIPEYFDSKPVKIRFPLIVYNGQFIIDGHHRWSQIYALNPNAEALAINFIGKLPPIGFLKAVQGCIGATMVAQGKEDPKLPSSRVEKGMNIYDTNDKKIEKYISDNIVDIAYKLLMKEVESINDKTDAIDYITQNCIDLKNYNKPIEDAPGRPYMPQTDKIEPHPNDNINSELKERMTKIITIKDK